MMILGHPRVNITFQMQVLLLVISSCFHIKVCATILQSGVVSHPGNLTKSNSDDLWSSPVSTPELRSNESLYQESDIPLNH